MRKIWLPVLGLSVLAFLAVIAHAQATDVSGEWEMTMEIPQRGPMTQTLKIVQDGEKITVTMVSQRGESTGEGTVKGKDIEWSVTRTGRDGTERTITYKGTVEGTTMSGTVEFGQMGSMEWKATKK
jgi:hypothetical protein